MRNWHKTQGHCECSCCHCEFADKEQEDQCYSHNWESCEQDKIYSCCCTACIGKYPVLDCIPFLASSTQKAWPVMCTLNVGVVKREIDCFRGTIVKEMATCMSRPIEHLWWHIIWLPSLIPRLFPRFVHVTKTVKETRNKYVYARYFTWHFIVTVPHCILYWGEKEQASMGACKHGISGKLSRKHQWVMHSCMYLWKWK